VERYSTLRTTSARPERYEGTYLEWLYIVPTYLLLDVDCRPLSDLLSLKLSIFLLRFFMTSEFIEAVRKKSDISVRDQYPISTRTRILVSQEIEYRVFRSNTRTLVLDHVGFRTCTRTRILGLLSNTKRVLKNYQMDPKWMFSRKSELPRDSILVLVHNFCCF
jgi:hypothetical protein